MELVVVRLEGTAFRMGMAALAVVANDKTLPKNVPGLDTLLAWLLLMRFGAVVGSATGFPVSIGGGAADLTVSSPLAAFNAGAMLAVMVDRLWKFIASE